MIDRKSSVSTFFLVYIISVYILPRLHSSSDRHRTPHPLLRLAPDHIDMHDHPMRSGYPTRILNVFNL